MTRLLTLLPLLMLGALAACGGGDATSPVSTSPTPTSGAPSGRPQDVGDEAPSPAPTATRPPEGDQGSPGPTGGSADESVDDPDITYSRRTPFVPLDNPVFLTAQEEDFLFEDDLVLGLEWGEEARAYPVRMLRFHHIVNETVGGQPLLITY